MFRFWLVTVFLWMACASADPLTKTQIQEVCEYLLATPQADLAGPIDNRAIETLLRELYSIKEIGVRSTPVIPLAHPRVQTFVREWSDLLRSHKDPKVRALSDGLRKWHLKPVSRTTVIDDQIPSALSAHAKAHIENELAKLPAGLSHLATDSGRTMYITFGDITQSPLMAAYRGVVPRGWNLPWDKIPGAGGGREGAVADVERLVAGPDTHGSVNLTLHEVLHNIDYACGDWTGIPLSERPEFQRRWRETDFQPGDDYMKNYPEESFAEFGAMYFHSPATRQMLRDLYPEWHEYFRELSTRADNCRSGVTDHTVIRPGQT